MLAHPSEPAAPDEDGLTGQTSGQQKRVFFADHEDLRQRSFIVQAGQNPTQALAEVVLEEVYGSSQLNSILPPSHTQALASHSSGA